MSDLPPNVYRVAQRRFDAIPGNPWVYWVSDSIRTLFETLPQLGEVAQPRQGLATADNFRFLRYWWEVGTERIDLRCTSPVEAVRGGKRWFPAAKGSRSMNWGGAEYEVINWRSGGKELRSFGPSVIRNPDYFFRFGVTLSRVGPSGFSARLNPGGCVLDSSNSASFPRTMDETINLLGIVKSRCAIALLSALNPTINFQVGDLAILPIPSGSHSTRLHETVCQIVRQVRRIVRSNELTSEFSAPWQGIPSCDTRASAMARRRVLETQANEEAYRLYGVSDEDRTAIDADLTGGVPPSDGDEEIESASDGDDAEEPEALLSGEEMAIRWISYAVGIVLGRFRPGVAGDLGAAIYRRSDFAIGSLPEPEEAEFDELVGPLERFAYIDAEGGRHVFSAEVETALRTLAVPDGIAVLDDGHPRDLVGLVEQALRLMLDGVIDDLQLTIDDSASANRQSSISNRKSDEVVQVGAGGDLRKFLERDFFTKWHLRWYRKRPVYWPLQSSRRSYGFVLFHERIDRMTLYTLQRDYLDIKLNGLRLEIGDLRGQAEGQSGAARRRIERQIDQVTQLLDEIGEFAKTTARIVSEGYEPEPNWIDDGVILRMAPLWELVPIWKAEPRKYWERLQKGDYDWSHIAMHYWPKRVKAACKTDKSFAIAHGHEEWYRGSG